jgi:hypothetical protein
MLVREHLSPEQREFIDYNYRIFSELKKSGLYVPIYDNRMTSLVDAGLVFIGCPDGDHSHDMFNHFCRYTRRVHFIGLNGGAVMMSPRHPKRSIEGQALFNSAKGALDLEKGKTVGFGTHLVCGGMLGEMCDIAHATQLLLEGKDDFVAQTAISPKATVAFMHVDLTPFETDLAKKKRRTHIIKGSRRNLLNPYLR